MDAYLICPETKKLVWLGKPIRARDQDGEERVLYYHREGWDGPRNHEIALLNKVLWKFLADHAHKELRVVFSGEFDEEEYDWIGIEDFEMEDYLSGWPPE